MQSEEAGALENSESSQYNNIIFSAKDIVFPSFAGFLFRVRVTKRSNHGISIWIENRVSKRQWSKTIKSEENLGSLGFPFEMVTKLILVITSHFASILHYFCFLAGCFHFLAEFYPCLHFLFFF